MKCYLPSVQSSSVAQLCLTLRLHGLQQARLPCASPTPRVYSLMSIESVMPSNHLILCRPPSPPTFSLSQHQGLYKWVSSLHQVAKVLEFQLQLQFQLQEYSFFPVNIQDGFPLGLTGWISLQSRSQESSPAPQFKNINSSALSFLYSPTLTSIHDYWRNHSFD